MSKKVLAIRTVSNLKELRFTLEGLSQNASAGEDGMTGYIVVALTVLFLFVLGHLTNTGRW
jgi:hypothetical protein